MKATKEDQRRLLELQKVDIEIRRLQVRLSALPEQQALDAKLSRLDEVGGELLDAMQRLENLKLQTTRHERQISEYEAGRRAEEARMYSGQITNERQLEAIKEEVAALRRRKSDTEDSLLEIMEQTEVTTDVVGRLQSEKSELTHAVATLTEARDAAAGELRGELAKLQEQRATITADVKPDHLAAYDKAAEGSNGRAVGQLAGRMCTACGLDLTGVELEETKALARDSLAPCPQCGAIIVT